MTIKERLKAISPSYRNGMTRILLVEGTKDIDDTLKIYSDRLEETKGPTPDPSGTSLLNILLKVNKSANNCLLCFQDLHDVLHQGIHSEDVSASHRFLKSFELS